MAWGDAAAEQYEKDQPSTCLRPDGAKPELEPLADREDFHTRIARVLGKHRIFKDELVFGEDPMTPLGTPVSAEREAELKRILGGLDTEMDQLVLMRAAQILDEAAERRKSVLAKIAAGAVRQANAIEEPKLRYSEIVLDDAERRGD